MKCSTAVNDATADDAVTLVVGSRQALVLVGITINSDVRDFHLDHRSVDEKVTCPA